MDTPAAPIPPFIAPPARQLPFWRALAAMRDNPIAGWPQAIYEQPVYLPPRRDFRLLYLCEPTALRTVLVDNAADFTKSPVWMGLLKPLLGEGLLTAEAESWRWQRQAAAPAFQPRRVEACAEAIGAAADRAVSRWESEAASAVRDIGAELNTITFEVILDAMFGGRGEVDSAGMSQAFSAYLEALGRPSLFDLFGAPQWLKRFTAPAAHEAAAYLRRSVGEMIECRRRSPRRGDLYDALAEARDAKTGRAMSDGELCDNLLTFLAGGHETTALALTWSIFLVAIYPEVQARIRAEVDAVAGEKAICANTAGELRFTRQVIQETMRLYPPLPALSRVAKRAGALAGEEVRRGDVVIVPIYALHRHRLYWDNPDAFDPSRFAGGAGGRRYHYMPFGAGQRVCIGAAFAMLEATILLAALVRRAQFTAIAPDLVRPKLRLALRPEGPLAVEVKILPGERRRSAA
ncbi:MAG TPA: cytochrome P450 [Vitreimonas sp.]|uniref:cytochrome P450 n=1 Tax=Vitreimonas sp. TaxID=3069702 RepID=UPI002D5BDCD0|nr:cytochrome P450 [Vitreimonas sp.]HYD86013.1 cytochrome P450 [Vitreimonas sp.]